jgi:hypothetical protein
VDKRTLFSIPLSLEMAAADAFEARPANPYHQLYPKQKNDRLLAGEKRFNTLIEQVNFGATSAVHKLELLNGRTSL